MPCAASLRVPCHCVPLLLLLLLLLLPPLMYTAT
jgi:hypothetical protein